MTVLRSWARGLLLATAALLLASCGGGGGGGSVAEKETIGVFSGITRNFNFDFQGAVGEGAIGVGASGDGGIGAGGALGQFRNALVKVYYLDGNPVGNGEALTDAENGMVTIYPGRSYSGGLLVEIHGTSTAEYFEEGKETYVPFPPGRVIRAIVPSVDKNIGVTPFTDAAYELAVACAAGSVALVCETGGGGANDRGIPREIAAVKAANDHVKSVLNSHFAESLQVDDVTRLPYIVGAGTGAGAVPVSSQRGRYGLMNVAFSKQAAMFNTAESSPTLLAIDQLKRDLLDGVLDGQSGSAPAATAGRRTYDPATLATELSAALAQQTTRYGTTEAVGALPRIVGYGNSRYDSYFFEARVQPDGTGATVPVGTESTTPTRTPGNPTNYVPGNNPSRRAYAVFGNMGSGSLFIKTDERASSSTIQAIGDNTNGELGSGSRSSTSQSSPTFTITFPGVVTHMAGGFGHSLARLADGSVHAWGDNAYGQLGQGVIGGSVPRALTPTRVTLPAGALSVAAGNTSSFALLEDGRLFSWGSNWGFGTLGNGSKDGARATPGAVMTAAGALDGVVQIAVRDNDGIALRRDGTVWTWGSFPASVDTTATDFAPVANAGGRQVATQVTGLPTTGRVRKVMTEQGLFAALISGGPEDGAVYTWGVYFDLTAKRVLVDLTPRRVLNLPPLRDMMPGGFSPYGERPFDRDTALGADFQGRYWRIRGRVAERYDPAAPLVQRRPKAEEGRAQCDDCHTVRGRTVPRHPDSGPACGTIPEHIRVLLTSQSECEACHNGQPLRASAALPILECTKPALPAPVPRPAPAALGTTCSLPAIGHAGMTAGTNCSTCHNSVIAAPLRCLPGTATFAAPLTLVATITQILDNAPQVVAPGGVTNDSGPSLRGTLGASLGAGQAVQVLRDSAVVGTASVTGSAWAFEDSGLTTGSYRYTARVAGVGTSAFGPLSAGYPIGVDLVAPNQTLVIASMTDNVGSGAFVGTFSASPVTSDDNTPTLNGTLTAALGSGERLEVVRNGSVVGTATVSGLNWVFTDTLPSNASYGYQARVVDSAGNTSLPSNSFTINLLAGPTAVVNIAQVFAPSSIVSGGTATSSAPILRLSFSRALLQGERLALTRQASGAANPVTLNPSAPAPGATSLDVTDALPSNGTYTYSARIVNDAGNQQPTPSSFVVACPSCVPLPNAVSGLLVEADMPLPARTLVDGGVTADTRPTIRGTLSGPLSTAGLSVRVVRRQAGVPDVEQTATLNASTGAWFLDEPSALPNGTYTYTARAQAGAVSGATSSGRAVTISVLPTFVGSPTFADDLGPLTSTVRPSGSETDDTTPTLRFTLSAAPSAGQSVSVVQVTGASESTLAGALSTVGGAVTFSPTNALVNGNTFTRGESEAVRLSRILTYTLRAIVSDASPARQSSDIQVLLQPQCVWTAASHGTSGAQPTCTNCHVSGTRNGFGAGVGPGFTCRQ